MEDSKMSSPSEDQVDFTQTATTPNIKKLISKRNGYVLGKGTILKLDQYAPIHGRSGNEDPSPQKKRKLVLSGAPNFRRIPGARIYAVGQPTVFGIYTALNRIKQEAPDKFDVTWINLREEPIIYINKRPFVLREADHPLRNFSYAGLTARTIDDMERRLKEDILSEAASNGNNVLVHIEQDDEITACWEGVNHSVVQTSGEIYESLLRNENYQIKYVRLPSTPERAPAPTLMDQILQALQDATSHTSVIFNCQIGVGRSTLAAVLTFMYFYHKKMTSPLEISSSLQVTDFSVAAAMKAGNYKAVLDLVAMLDNGVDAKARVDAIIDLCSEYENVREAIQTHKARHTHEAHAAGKGHLMRARTFLERYVLAIAFWSYLEDSNSLIRKKNGISFKDWTLNFTEFQSLVGDIRTDPDNQLRTVTVGDGKSPSVTRKGSVLTSGFILKADLQDQSIKLRSSATIHITDPKASSNRHAPHFRKTEKENCYGTGSPTLMGVKEIISKIYENDKVNNANSKPKILWINLREEAAIFINGKPFALREESHPFENLRYPVGTSADRLEKLEERLVKDVIDESKEKEKVLVHEETEESHILSRWEKIGENSIKTYKEIFASMNEDDIDIRYVRIPITIGSAPDLSDFDCLVKELISIDEKTHVVFQCQMGRGRSTLGTIVYSIVNMWKNNQPLSVNMDIVRRKYEYRPILNMLRVLEDGQQRRREVDAIIDLCGESYNLRTKIDDTRDKYEKAREEEGSRDFLRRIEGFIQRYFSLILFDSYASSQLKGIKEGDKYIPFSEWYASRPEIMTISRELHENPAKAFQTFSDSKMSWEVINSRHGDVMGVNTILKSDHFPGCQRMSLLPHIPGAPNYRQVQGLCVYGVAIPTIEGMKNTINHLLKTSNTSVPPKKVLWISLREEPVIYINQRPFVLRNYDSPFSNLEYTGIDTNRVEEMEQRLKRDILSESSRYEGKFLIHDENNDGKTFEAWEQVDESTVMTPRQVYKRLAEEGYPVSYVRVAITDEQSPEYSDFDDLVQLIKDTDRSTTGIVFNCQVEDELPREWSSPLFLTDSKRSSMINPIQDLRHRMHQYRNCHCPQVARKMMLLLTIEESIVSS
eukprot:TRINITY_DN3878_c0_g1_i1.p1 TRINITY_DN3878_c0_g1~~TRINITY_DN3878_c0_g1_i1.p1  ORF type:complete len:1108 (-),score=338.31 TRINITY_DN3878_c0_g1_i1:397-3720(-)